MLSKDKINAWLLPKPKILYFALAVTFYMFHQFRGQFIIDNKFAEKGQLGLYLSIPQAISFFSNIHIGAVNDRSGMQKLILLGLFAISALFFDSFFWSDYKWAFWAYYTLYFAFMSATIPLLDKVMMDYVSGIPGMGAKAVGSQRLWLTFGYLAVNFSVEHIIATEDEEKPNYGAMRPFNIGASIISIVLIALFVNNLPRRQSTRNTSGGSIVALLKNFEYMYFIFIILLCGISRAFMTTYLGVYYSKVLQFNDQKNTLNLPSFLNTMADFAYDHKQSTSTVFGVLLELIIFYKSAFIMDKLGLYMPIALSMVLQLLRFVCYLNISYTNKNSFALVCLCELIKGASYSLIHSSAIQLANYLCPPDLRTTSQLFYNGAFVALGTVISGVLFKSFFTETKDTETSYQEFSSAFMCNIMLTIACLGFFMYRYGWKENLIFNRENARKKLEEYETQANSEHEEENLSETAKNTKIAVK